MKLFIYFFFFLIFCTFNLKGQDTSIVYKIQQKYKSIITYQEQGTSKYFIISKTKLDTSLSYNYVFSSFVDNTTKEIKFNLEKTNTIQKKSFFQFLIEGEKYKSFDRTEERTFENLGGNIKNLTGKSSQHSIAIALMYPHRLMGTKLLIDKETKTMISFEKIDNEDCYKIVQTRINIKEKEENAKELNKSILKIADSLNVKIPEEALFDQSMLPKKKSKVIIEDTYWFRKSDLILIKQEQTFEYIDRKTIRISFIQPTINQPIDKKILF
jgi:hypothetical protein